MNTLLRYAIVILAALVAQGAANAQMAMPEQYTSTVIKEAYYLNGDYKELRKKLIQDMRGADVPAVYVFGEATPAKPRDLVLILDELAELHTYFDPNQDQVKMLNRRILALLKTDLTAILPGYATRYSYLSQLSRSQVRSDIELNHADLRLTAGRVERREHYFRDQLVAIRPESTGALLADLMTAWNALNSNTPPRHRLIIARRIAQAAAITAPDKSTARLATVLSKLPEDPTLGLREKIEASLLAAYFDALAGNAAGVVSRYQSIPGSVRQEIEAEQQMRRERVEQFELLSRQNREFLDNKQAVSTVATAIVTFAAAWVGQGKMVKTAEGFKQSGKTQEILQNIDNSMKAGNDLSGIISHQETWRSNAIGTTLNRDMETLTVLHRYIDIPLILELMPHLIAAHAAQGKHEDVLAMADLYFGYANAIRGRTYGANNRKAFQSRMERVFRAVALAAFATGKVDTLLELSEAYSSHILLDAIVSGRTRLDRTDADATASPGNIEALTNFVKLADAKPLKTAEVVAYLKNKNISMVRIFEMDGKLGLLFAGADGVYMVSERGSAAEILALSTDVHGLVTTEKSDRKALASTISRNPIGRFLSTHLFKGNEPLLVIPSDGLMDFPFAVLTNIKSKTPLYLIEQRPLIRHLSVSIAKIIGDQGNRAKGAFVSLGNPTLIREYAGADPLPGAELESREAAALMQGKSYIGSEATQEVLLAALRNNEIVHIASHGQFIDEEPLDSRLIIPSADGKVGGLSAFRLYGQGIKASTVFLSACDLGQNRRAHGNEINGFIRPLLMQSTKNIMTNLWEVTDEGGYVVTMSILKHIKAGTEISLAFQEGIKEVIANPKYANPYYWAPFALFAAK